MRDVFFRRGLASCSIILSLAGTACVERIPTPPDQIAQRAQIAQERGIPGREDTPWRRMTDAALAASIRQADGKVFIGFKDSAAIVGVDATGRTLASPQSVARGKALVRDLGIEVTREYSRIPAVVARMSEGTLSALRRRGVA